MQLKVIKADGSIEEYLHTKVIATLIRVITPSCESDTFAAEQLADSVTFYLYKKYDRPEISSYQIFSIIKAAIDSAGYHNAALLLTENHHYRNLLRSRIEVVKAEVETITDAAELNTYRKTGISCLWNKSIIASDLIETQGFNPLMARVVASMVEDKILKSDLRCIPTSFIKHLVLTDAAAVQEAEKIFETQASSKKTGRVKNKNKNKDTDVRLGQQQKGLCTVEI
ncbi:MAG: hypothetical protein K8R02_01835 [Anaerohalosphaeraceae bacterium]|nr:hypothetical protein [Anaerohalosphaeraceae bacterium]